jgi:hypothetical protein
MWEGVAGLANDLDELFAVRNVQVNVGAKMAHGRVDVHRHDRVNNRFATRCDHNRVDGRFATRNDDSVNVELMGDEEEIVKSMCPLL